MFNLRNNALIGFLTLVISCEVMAKEPTLDYDIQLDVALQELTPDYCWFHPRVASAPGLGDDGNPLVVLTIQKHLGASDHYSGLHYMISRDLGKTWTKPVQPEQLDWWRTENGETIGVCDVTPVWHAKSEQFIAIGTQLRYNDAGLQLLDQPRSYEAVYSIYTPETDRWTKWQSIEIPMGEENQFHHVAPGCVQWLIKEDGTILLPIYFQGPEEGPYDSTVVHATFDGQRVKYVSHGDILELNEVRGLVEPSLTKYQGKYYLTLRNDNRAYVTTSEDGLHYEPIKVWTFEDGTDLGSYNTQQHWVTHSEGLFLSYTRRGANNDHIMRNRAPLFIAKVDTDNLVVLRKTEKVLIPEKGAMLGNFGASRITANEWWVTDSEFINDGKAKTKGANGSTYISRVKWNRPDHSEK